MRISVLLAGDLAFREALAAALGGDYGLIEADSVNAAAEALLAARPALAVVDLRGDSGAGGAICRRIKGAASTRLLPIVACADPGEAQMVSALDAGADHVLGFPPSRAELHARLRAALRTRLATERLEDATQVIFALANAVEAKDAYTEGHTERVGGGSGPPGRTGRGDLRGAAPGGRAARHREDRDPQRDHQQGGPAHRQGADRDEQAPHHRGAHLRAAQEPAPPAPHHPLAPREARRQRLSGRHQGRGV